MKKMLLFAAVAIGMAACTNETDVITLEQPREVNFKTAAKNATRAAVTSSYVPIDATIYVSAFQKEGSTYENYFSNTAFKYAGSGDSGQGSWTGGVFWPKSGTLDLMAYCCGKADEVLPNSVTLVPDTTNKRIGSLVLDYTTNKLAGKTDVMWSEVALDKSSDFTLTFRHALAWVMVNFVHSGSTTDDDAIKLRNIKLNGVSLSGKLTVTPKYDSSTFPYTVDWTDLTTAVDMFFPAFTDDNGNSPEMNFTNAANLTSQGLMIVPGNQTSITFEYCTKNGTDANGSTYTNWHTYTIGLNQNDNWEAGKKYTYKISVSTTSIAFTTEVKAWDATTVDKTLN